MDFYVQDPSPRPWKFRPEGYLVVILSDADEGQRAQAVLVAAGFAARDIKLYTGKQILVNFEVYAKRRSVADKVAGSVMDDSEGRELYLAYAREDRSALWLRLPDDTDVPKALRALADSNYVHTRHYGPGKQQERAGHAHPPLVQELAEVPVASHGDDEIGPFLVGKEQGDVLARARRAHDRIWDAEVLQPGLPGGESVPVGVEDDLGRLLAPQSFRPQQREPQRRI